MREPPRFDTALWAKRTATVAVTTLLLVAAIWVLWRGQIALTITVAALLVAVALNRPVDWLARHGVRRGLGIAGVMLLLVALLAGIAIVLIPPAVNQIRQLVEHWPTLLARVRHTDVYGFLQRHLDLDELLGRAQERAPTLARGLVSPAVSAAAAVLGGVAGLVTVLFMVVFMLATGRQLVWSLLARASPSHRMRYAQVLNQIYRSIGGYIGGLLLIVLLNATLAGTFLAILGVPYFLPLAVFSGVSSLVPYVGAIVAGLLLSLVAWVNGGLWAAVGTVAYYIAYQQFESHVVAPLVYRRTVDLNPLVILIAVLFLTELGGIPGAFVAVPLAAAVKIVAREIARVRQEHLGLPPVPAGPELLHRPERAEDVPR